MNKQPVAFFDFDGTLTNGDTLMPFLKFVVGRPVYYAKLALLSPVLGAYCTKLLRNDVAKDIVVRQYLSGYRQDKLLEMGERFSTDIIPTMLRPEGVARLQWHKGQGHACVLVSASLDVYLNPWAYLNGFDDIICTKLQCAQGSVGRLLLGENCHGRQKVAEIRRYLAGSAPETTYAYGDTIEDRHMLECVDFGYMFEGDELKLLEKG